MWANAQYERRPVQRLELLQLAAVDEPAQHLAHVVGRARVQRDDVQQSVRVLRRAGAGDALPRRRARRRKRVHDRPDDLQRVAVVVREVVDDAGGPRVDVPAPELLGGDLLARSRPSRAAGRRGRSSPGRGR